MKKLITILFISTLAGCNNTTTSPTTLTPLPNTQLTPTQSLISSYSTSPVDFFAAYWQVKSTYVSAQLYNNSTKDEDMGVACYLGPPNLPDRQVLGDSEIVRVKATSHISVTVDISCGGSGQCDAFYDLKSPLPTPWYNSRLLSGRIVEGGDCPVPEDGEVIGPNDPVPCLSCEPGCGGCSEEKS